MSSMNTASKICLSLLSLTLAVLVAPFVGLSAHAEDYTDNPFGTQAMEEYWNQETFSALKEAAESNIGNDFDYMYINFDNNSAWGNDTGLIWLSDYKVEHLTLNGGSLVPNPFYGATAYGNRVKWSKSSHQWEFVDSTWTNYSNYSALGFLRTYGITANVEEPSVDTAANGDFTFQYQFIDFSQEEIDDKDPENEKVLLQSYLQEHGFKIPKYAYLAPANDHFGNQRYQMPIYDQSYDPTGKYQGLYVKVDTTSNPYLVDYKVAITPDVDPNNYETQWGWDLVITYESVSYHEITLLSLQNNDLFGHDNAKVYIDEAIPEDGKTGIWVVGGRSYNGFKATETVEGNNVNKTANVSFTSAWWYNGYMTDLRCGISYTTVDENGQVTEGEGSTEYNEFVTNYINNSVINNFGGTDNGISTFTADWGGENVPNSTFDYSNNLTDLDDTNTQSFYSDIFTVGNGYFKKLAIAVLAIVFIAYILYGKGG